MNLSFKSVELDPQCSVAHVSLYLICIRVWVFTRSTTQHANIMSQGGALHPDYMHVCDCKHKTSMCVQTLFMLMSFKCCSFFHLRGKDHHGVSRHGESRGRCERNHRRLSQPECFLPETRLVGQQVDQRIRWSHQQRLTVVPQRTEHINGILKLHRLTSLCCFHCIQSPNSTSSSTTLVWWFVHTGKQQMALRCRSVSITLVNKAMLLLTCKELNLYLTPKLTLVRYPFHIQWFRKSILYECLQIVGPVCIRETLIIWIICHLDCHHLLNTLSPRFAFMSAGGVIRIFKTPPTPTC